jgi:hypothetical protein
MHVFTAATKEYADPVLEKLPDVFDIRLYRESVTDVGKDLAKITNSQDIVLVDDQLRNKVGDQLFYHMPVYTRHLKFDIEMLRFAAWAIWWNIEADFSKMKNCFFK